MEPPASNPDISGPAGSDPDNMTDTQTPRHIRGTAPVAHQRHTDRPSCFQGVLVTSGQALNVQLWDEPPTEGVKGANAWPPVLSDLYFTRSPGEDENSP